MLTGSASRSPKGAREERLVPYTVGHGREMDALADDLCLADTAPLRSLFDDREVFRISVDVGALHRHVPMLAYVPQRCMIAATGHPMSDASRPGRHLGFERT